MAASAMLLCVSLGGHYAMNRRDSALQNELTQRAQTLTGRSRIQRGLEIRQAREALEQFRETLEPIREQLEAPLSARLTDLTRIALEQGIRIDDMDLRSNSVRMNGSTPEASRCERLALALENEGFKTVLQRELAGPDGRVPFRLEGERP